ncbi:MAG: polysaccharide biosynthesis tyrosine autokinase [Bacteroidetes bacterium]|nr:polysaccharide biosynthesis tyrosine autokinase [Bacteroidota bacterium]
MQDPNSTHIQVYNEKGNDFDFKYLVAKVLGNWYWYVLSGILCFGIAILYNIYATPMYHTYSRVLVNGENGNKTSAGLSESSILTDLGLFSTQTDVNNELQIILSKTILNQAIRDLQLNVTYWSQGDIRYQESYDKSPFFIKILNLVDVIDKPFEYDIRINKNKVSFTDDETDSSFTATWGDTLNFHYGKWVLEKNPAAEETDSTHQLGMKIDSYGNTYMNVYLDNVTAFITTTDVTTIDLNVDVSIRKKGEDLLNKIIQLYVQSSVDANNKVADSTIAFIDSRMVGVSKELGDIDRNIEGFKKSNNLTDLDVQSKALVETTADIQNQVSQQDVQIKVIQDLINYLNDDRNNERIMPTTAPISDPAFVALLERYNSMQLDRQKSLLNLTENNPAVKSIDMQLVQQRSDLLKMLKTFLNGLVVNQADLKRRNSLVDNSVQKVPTQQRIYLDYSRQQAVLQGLFTYLLQTKEQTEVSRYNNISPIRIIDAPQADPLPYWPSGLILYLSAFVLGCLIPSAVLFFKELLNNKVLTPNDISNETSVPVVAEINHNKSEDVIAVAKDSRTAISEQFRTLRTNMQYLMTGSDDKVVMMTSSMSGEGKTFVAINLGSALAISGKKVVIVEMDLRKPKVSSALGISNENGMTNYIVTNVPESSVIKPTQIHENCFLVSSGTIPPNPSELITNPKVASLFTYLRENFDYIIVDAPPVGLVTDALIIGQFTDLNFYIIRQKYTFKRQIKLVEELFINNRLKRLNIILNDVKKIAGYNYGYGYGYGKGYGYGYYEEKKQKSLLKRMFSKN